MNHSGTTIAKQRDREVSRGGDTRPVRNLDPRRRVPAEQAKRPQDQTELREDWFDRTFEQLRGFLDEMFR